MKLDVSYNIVVVIFHTLRNVSAIPSSKSGASLALYRLEPRKS